MNLQSTTTFMVTFGLVSAGWLGATGLVVSAERSRHRAFRPRTSTQPRRVVSETMDRPSRDALGPVLFTRLAKQMRSRFGGDRAIDAQLSILADAIANELGAGTSLQQAFFAGASSVGGVVEIELAETARRVERGQSFRDALCCWPRVETLESARLLVAVCAMSSEVGGPSADTFRRLAERLRGKRQLDNDIRAASAQAKASAGMLACLPFGAALLMSALDPEVGRWLMLTPLGWSLLAAGIGLDLLGVRWMVQMVRAVS